MTPGIKWTPAKTAAFVVLVLATLVLCGYLFPMPWTGLGGGPAPAKTLWDWLDLLMVPGVLAGLGVWFNRVERRADLASAEATARSAALHGYLDQMSVLLVDKGLLASSEDSPLRTVARAQTLAVLKRQDGAGRGTVLQFLYESGLITAGFAEGKRTRSVVRLAGADLRDADADGLDLKHADFAMVDLSYARLRGADLTQAIMTGSKMRGADLRSGTPFWAVDVLAATTLIGADLRAADLTGARVSATFEKAVLRGAVLRDADLMTSTFKGADLHNAKLDGANLRGVEHLDPSSLATVESMTGAGLVVGLQALAPQEVDLNVDAPIGQHEHGQPAHISGRAKGTIKVVLAPDSIHVGMRLSLGNASRGAAGLTITFIATGDEWVSEGSTDPTWKIPRSEGQAMLGIDLTAHPRQGYDTRALRLACILSLDGSGKLESLTLSDVSFLPGEDVAASTVADAPA